MFDPQLFDVAKARRAEELAAARQRQKYRLLLQNSDQALNKMKGFPLYSPLLDGLGNFLIYCGQWLVARAQGPQAAVAKAHLAPQPPCCSC